MSETLALVPEFEALREFLALRDDLCELEGCEDQCTCRYFETCGRCQKAADKMFRQRRLLELWGETWARLLNTALPYQVWCECGHISGQHAGHYPHKCAVDGGCEKGCYGFRARRLDAAAIAEAAANEIQGWKPGMGVSVGQLRVKKIIKRHIETSSR